MRRAVQEYEAKTCLRFVEVSNYRGPRVKVCVTDSNSCSAGVGYPGNAAESTLNLGWCNSITHVGNIIHELGHIIGMNHEQNRPDGSAQTSVPGARVGPHLRVHWHNIPNTWRPQYTPVSNSYIGSNNQGGADPVNGYAPYDYGSIMHYPRSSPARFDTVNAAFNSVVGQRSQLSNGDLTQISDMYQCRRPGTGGPIPSPSPTGCQDSQPPRGWAPCNEVRGKCNDAQYGAQVRQYCPRTCGTCNSRPAPSPTPSTSGCQDRQPPKGWPPCNEVGGYCNDAQHGAQVRQYCPRTCGRCNAAPTSSCPDNPPAGWTMTCAQLRGYCHKDNRITQTCRRTCGLCR